MNWIDWILVVVCWAAVPFVLYMRLHFEHRWQIKFGERKPNEPA